MIETLANDSLSIGLFPWTGADEKAPAHLTLTLLKNRLVNDAGSKAYEELFDEITRIAQEKRVNSYHIQKKDENKKGWLKLKESLKERNKV